MIVRIARLAWEIFLLKILKLYIWLMKPRLPLDIVIHPDGTMYRRGVNGQLRKLGKLK